MILPVWDFSGIWAADCHGQTLQCQGYDMDVPLESDLSEAEPARTGREEYRTRKAASIPQQRPRRAIEGFWALVGPAFGEEILRDSRKRVF